MKCKVPKQNYIQMPLKMFLNINPEFRFKLSADILSDVENYIIRMNENMLEIGYVSDKWIIC